MIFKISSAPNLSSEDSSLPLRLARPLTRKIIAIGGGKGGVGKTMISANLAISLAWAGKRVVAVDLDLGGANLHTSLGAPPATETLSDLIAGRVETMPELVKPTTIRNLSLISGANDALNVANLPHPHKTRLMQQFDKLDADYVLLDLGAGTTTNTLDFFLLADQKLLVVTPEPTSIENAYRFMKAALFRKLRGATSSLTVRQKIEEAIQDPNQAKSLSPKALFEKIAEAAPLEIQPLQLALSHFRFRLVLNQVRSLNEAAIGKNIERVATGYFGVGVDYLGYLPYDNAIWQAIRKRTPFLVDSPHSEAANHLHAISRQLIQIS